MEPRQRAALLIFCCAILGGGGPDVNLEAAERGQPWQRHTIDDSSRGADGVRVADVNGDGLVDLTTGWEEGGQVRVYLNPGPKQANRPWPAVTVGQARSVEDAVFVDLDADGAVDVVSSCEGKTQSMFVHWAPREPDTYLKPAAWETLAIPQSQNRTRWMFCLPMDVDGRAGIDLVAGSKDPNAQIGWWQSPKHPRRLEDWRWHSIYEGGWIMSLFARDVDGDGDADVVMTDRKGESSGCFWLENPGVGGAQTANWPRHAIGGLGQEVMFLNLADVDGDNFEDAVCAVRGGPILFFRRVPGDVPTWETREIELPGNTGTGKGVHVGDLDLDGKNDVVFTCENAKDASGVVWLSAKESVLDADWEAHEISGQDAGAGIKFDLIQLMDLDADGDLDVVTCEERDNLGVIWYENPTR